MARPRTVSDDAILAAAVRVIVRDGPAALTLAAAGAEAGLAASTLVQRFGSKRGLLLAVARDGVARVAPAFAAARAGAPEPLDALRAALAGALAGTDRAEMAHHIAFLSLDVADPELRALAAAHAHATRAEIGALLRAAGAEGALAADVDADALARTVHVAFNGALVLWALTGEGPLEAAVAADVDAVLAPHRTLEAA